MKLTASMAYDRPEDMIFGSAKHPVTTRRGLVLGGGAVVPEVAPHPRPGSEASLKSLLREFERANGDVLERCVQVGLPSVVIENEHVFQMTHNPEWGKEIAAQTASQIEEHHAKYGLKTAYRSTIADIRKPDMVPMRDSDRTHAVLESFKACAKHSDILSIESMGGKEISDYALIRNDIRGMLFAQAVLGGRDVAWLWKQITDICREHDCIPGGDTACAQANTAMFMAGGFTSTNVPQSLAALVRAISVSGSLAAYENGAVGPGKDCAYENPIIKAITGMPMSMEGKSSACAHMSLCGNVMAAVCDLWSNEAVEYHHMFGGSTAAVFTEILGYDAAAMNAAIALGHEKEFMACLVASDRYRSAHSFILCPDNAWKIGKTVVENNESLYARARAAAIECGRLMLGDPVLRFTDAEKSALMTYLKELDALPDDEDDFIDLCLDKYSRVKGFRPSSYGL